MRDATIPARARAILAFWIDEIGPAGWYAPPDPSLDAEVAARFGSDLTAAAAGQRRTWLTRAQSALAAMILLDQFPRHIHRGTGASFACDPQARAAAAEAIRRGHDLEIPEPERQFFYLPLMHSEVLADQDRCVHLIRQRLRRTGRENLSHARSHREVIRRFGRFPSRNAPLGREDSAAERAYRAQGGYMG